MSGSYSESPRLSFLSSFCGDGVKVHPIRLPHIVKRSISNRSFFVVLCVSSVDCGGSLLFSSGLEAESGGGSLVTSVTGGGATGKGFALGVGCLVMEGRWTLGSAEMEVKKKKDMILWKSPLHTIHSAFRIEWQTIYSLNNKNWCYLRVGEIWQGWLSWEFVLRFEQSVFQTAYPPC